MMSSRQAYKQGLRNPQALKANEPEAMAWLGLAAGASLFELFDLKYLIKKEMLLN